jgi:hypothetical protein
MPPEYWPAVLSPIYSCFSIYFNNQANTFVDTRNT